MSCSSFPTPAPATELWSSVTLGLICDSTWPEYPPNILIARSKVCLGANSCTYTNQSPHSALLGNLGGACFSYIKFRTITTKYILSYLLVNIIIFSMYLCISFFITNILIFLYAANLFRSSSNVGMYHILVGDLGTRCSHCSLPNHYYGVENEGDYSC